MLFHTTDAQIQEAMREGRRLRSAAFLSLFRRTKPNPDPEKAGCDVAPA